ncbi:cupin domain-containing protein [Bacillus cereus]|uniref:cupin domain-containing protein n=1 Tax=Bacillus cereus TaxID=1396 RepID=UPI0011455862|nr:cupin domain-containing protein [Bacillus cereus]MCD2338620.1 cupin domain-containing protein [Bacillus cereus]MCD2338706.1 cupin domain-containing protein [Bacillus cereus]
MENYMAVALPYVLKKGEGKTLQPAPDLKVNYKVTNKETNGQLSVLEYTLSPGLTGPKPHFHKKIHEIFYVINGKVTFLIDKDWVEVSEGGFIFVPKGTIHAFSNPFNVEAKIFSIFTPGGFEEYFEEYTLLRSTGITEGEKLKLLRDKYDNNHI